MARASRLLRGATANATSTTRSARMTRTLRPPIRMPGSIARPMVARAVCASWACADGEPQWTRRRRRAHSATGTAEREAALALLDRRRADRHITLGADKAYDVTAFVEDLRTRQVRPHIAVDGRVSKLGVVRTTAIDGRTTRHPGYRAS